ncbi:unnamed protein product [Aphanomyces euteiches]|uniref:FH2 domain-containing protein n=1 Tax=Aphanomyces euteiches TaxID=100861 RepID=A0A6G0WC67_9STRA|nr:hypothetical protein Ae201684_017318 [Aphanomyces euteiches]
MNQLRKLASYVVESSLKPASPPSPQAPPTPSFKHLDVTYITSRLLVAGRAIEGPTDKKSCTNNAVELKTYLDAAHAGKYLLFNFCDENSDAETISSQTVDFSWEREGGIRTYTPPSDSIFRICYAIFAWLALDSENVAMLYCHNGKTRSGVISACYFLFARTVDEPMAALAQFYQKRLGIDTLTPGYVKKSMPISIQRYVSNFATIMNAQAVPNPQPLLLKAIMFRALPLEVQPLVQIWDDTQMVFSTASDENPNSQRPVIDWNPQDGFLAILWETGILLDGGFSILCSFGDDYDDHQGDPSSRVLFRHMDSTWFHSEGLVTLKKLDLDMMKEYEHGFEDEHFSADIIFHESKTTPKSYVPVDFTGNYAVKQGIIEIASHHIVSPDPTMYSNFVKNGFDPDASTFALQRSQNAPNVALDILHSEGISTIFTQLPPLPPNHSPPKPSKSSPPKSNFSQNDNQHKDTAHQAISSDTPVGGADVKEDVFGRSSRRHSTVNPIQDDGFASGERLKRSYSTAVETQQSVNSFVDPKPSRGDALNYQESVCSVCREEDYVLRPQLVRCTGPCHMYFHTSCVGLKKIPFGLTTITDRTNHASYVKKFFGAWECSECKSRYEIEESRAADGRASPNSPTQQKLEKLKSLLDESGLSLNDLIKAADAKEPSQAQHIIEPSEAKNIDKYKKMIDNGVPLEATQNCMIRDGVNPTLLSNYTPARSIVPEEDKMPQVLLLKDAIQFEGYFTMLQKGCSKDAVKHKMKMCGLNPAILDLDPKSVYSEVREQIENLQAQYSLPRSPPKPISPESSSVAEPKDIIKTSKESDLPKPVEEPEKAPVPEAENHQLEDSSPTLKDDPVYGKYFKMLKMNIPEGAVRQKMIEHGVNLKALELGPDGLVSDLTVETKTLLKDDPVYGKYFKMLKMNIPEGAVRQKMIEHGVNVKALELGPDGLVSDLTVETKTLLKDDPVYGKYFKMLKMNIPEGAVRQKMIEHGVNVKALELGPEGLVSDLTKEAQVMLKDDPTYSKYFKMLKMNIPEGAVRQKMLEHGVNPRALDLGPEGFVSQLTGASPPKPTKKKVVRRKKLFWQPIPEDRLKRSSTSIWEDRDHNIQLDMDEIEALFFKETTTAKKPAAKPLNRKQAVTLVDGKRAMNAAIALARIKLSYEEVASAIQTYDNMGLTLEQLTTINEFLPTDDEVGIIQRYQGDTSSLGEAEKFFAAIAKVPRYNIKMECLIAKQAFPSHVTDVATSIRNITQACEDVKGSRLLKLLLGTVLKLGNTLNGGEETEHAIRGFSVDSLLRLGHTKTNDNKTTVLHYLVRVVRKNQVQVLDFQSELQHVPLAARESTESIEQMYANLESDVKKTKEECDRMQEEKVEHSTIETLRHAMDDADHALQQLQQAISEMKQEIVTVFEYFGEDPAKKPMDFFQTLTSFCMAFEKAKQEVQAADEAKQRSERSVVRPRSITDATMIDPAEKAKLIAKHSFSQRSKVQTTTADNGDPLDRTASSRF